jgi:hypothetical protein
MELSHRLTRKHKTHFGGHRAMIKVPGACETICLIRLGRILHSKEAARTDAFGRERGSAGLSETFSFRLGNRTGSTYAKIRRVDTSTWSFSMPVDAPIRPCPPMMRASCTSRSMTTGLHSWLWQRQVPDKFSTWGMDQRRASNQLSGCKSLIPLGITNFHLIVSGLPLQGPRTTVALVWKGMTGRGYLASGQGVRVKKVSSIGQAGQNPNFLDKQGNLPVRFCHAAWVNCYWTRQELRSGRIFWLSVPFSPSSVASISNYPLASTGFRVVRSRYSVPNSNYPWSSEAVSISHRDDPQP